MNFGRAVERLSFITAEVLNGIWLEETGTFLEGIVHMRQATHDINEETVAKCSTGEYDSSLRDVVVLASGNSGGGESHGVGVVMGRYGSPAPLSWLSEASGTAIEVSCIYRGATGGGPILQRSCFEARGS